MHGMPARNLPFSLEDTLVAVVQGKEFRVELVPELARFNRDILDEYGLGGVLSEGVSVYLHGTGEKRIIYADSFNPEEFLHDNNQPYMAVTRNEHGTHTPEGEPMRFWRMITHARVGESIFVYSHKSELYLPPTVISSQIKEGGTILI